MEDSGIEDGGDQHGENLKNVSTIVVEKQQVSLCDFMGSALTYVTDLNLNNDSFASCMKIDISTNIC